MRRVSVLLVALAAGLPVSVRAQGLSAGQWVGHPTEEYTRLIQLTGAMPLTSLLLRPADLPAVVATDSAPWRSPWSSRFGAPTEDTARRGLRWGLLTPLLRTTYNSHLADGINDGAMWAGRGTSMSVTFGVEAQWRMFRLQLAPEFTRSQNQPYPLAPLRDAAPTAVPFENRWTRYIDMPQRFGTASYATSGPGQSSLTADFRGTRIGVSTANMWWGSGIDNALLMTNHAAGFPHVFVGTRRPVDVKIGSLEALYTVGWLRSSDFWRTAADTFPDDRWMNSLSLVFEPRGAKGMYFGASRLFYAYRRDYGMGLHELLTLFQTFRKQSLADSANPHGEDRRDQMLALWFRWAYPSVGFEVYGEWGRNDHSWDLRDLNMQPMHSAGGVLGARKVFPVGSGILSVRAEFTDLTDAQTMFTRDTPRWYAHHRIQQGYTNAGQVIGAGIGPGSVAKTLAVDWFVPRGRVGLVVQHELPDLQDYLKALRKDTLTFGPYGVYNYQEAIVGGGPRVTWWLGGVQVDASYTKRLYYNHYNVYQADINNQHFELRATWIPRSPLQLRRAVSSSTPASLLATGMADNMRSTASTTRPSRP